MRTQPETSASARVSAPPHGAPHGLGSRTLHWSLPLLVSLGLHLVVFALLAYKTFDVLTRADDAGGEYVARVAPAELDSRAFNWSAEEPLEPPRDAPRGEAFEVFGQPDPNVTLPDLSDELRKLAADTPGDPGGDKAGAAGGLGIGAGGMSLLGTGSGAGGAGSGGLGEGFGAAGAGLGQAGVWDLSVHADRIAYVVDYSGSIIVAVDDLKRELKRSIGRLRPTQMFDVIVFYSTGAGSDERVRTESFRSRLEPADEGTRKAFFEWIDSKVPRGATEPLPAVQRALALSPDVIFLFSDGYFSDGLVDEITRANRPAPARIYCLVFDELLLQDMSDLPRETEGARRLKRIAEANGGRAKIVTGRDLAR